MKKKSAEKSEQRDHMSSVYYALGMVLFHLEQIDKQTHTKAEFVDGGITLKAVMDSILRLRREVKAAGEKL